MARPDLRMSFTDAEALARECESNLKHGRGFVQDAAGIGVLSDCTLVLVHPASGRTLSLFAQAVMVLDSGPMRGIGLQLRPFDTAVRDRIERFVAGDADAADAAQADPEPVPAPAVDATAAGASGEDGEAEDDSTGGPEADAGSEFDDDTGGATDADAADAADVADTDAETGSDEDADRAQAHPPARAALRATAPEEDVDEEADATSDGAEADDAPEGGEQRGDVHTQARIDVLRKMSHTLRQKLARKGELQDRVLLERLFGRDIWPQLLQNPKLTLPEVARIGRKRSVPQPLLTIIVDNNTWIQASVVRRALLSNPRIGHEAVDKLIRITPKHELKLMQSTLAYPGYVREAARKALKKE